MKPLHVVLAVLSVAVLAGGLTGCRSRAKAQQTPPIASAPAPTPYYSSSDATMAPPATSYPSQPTYSSGGVVVSRRVVPSPGAPGGMAAMGSPDDMMPGEDYPSAFPDAAPPSGTPIRTSPTPVIAAASSAGADVDVELNGLRAELAQIRRDLEHTPAATGGASSGAANGSALAAQFAQDLRSRTGADVEVNGNVVVVRVSDAFESGSNQLKKDASLMSTLVATANALSATPAAEVRVVGHSDATPLNRTKGKWGTNKRLSEARAQTVATELSRHGVPAGRMDVQGMGSSQPLVPEKTKSDQAKNRRVEVVIRF